MQNINLSIAPCGDVHAINEPRYLIDKGILKASSKLLPHAKSSFVVTQAKVFMIRRSIFHTCNSSTVHVIRTL